MKYIGPFTVAFFLLSCQEELSSDTSSLMEFTPSSGDTVFFFRQPGVDAFPLPPCTGYYKCPAMEHIDIDCNAQQLLASSSSAIFYPLQCIHDAEVTKIVAVISGIGYPQGAYCSGAGQIILPLYYGIHNNVPTGSKFDTPPSGVPSAQSQGLAIDLNTGTIDLDKSISNGIFGKPPHPGSQRIFRIYYRLNDQSQWTLNFTDVIVEFAASYESARTAEACGPGGGTVIIVKGLE
jgi:hypothetical protein